MFSTHLTGACDFNFDLLESTKPPGRYKVQFLIAAVSPETNRTMPMAGASIFNPDTSQWRASTYYDYLDMGDQAAKLYVQIYLKRHIIVRISAFLILIFNCLSHFN